MRHTFRGRSSIRVGLLTLVLVLGSSVVLGNVLSSGATAAPGGDLGGGPYRSVIGQPLKFLAISATLAAIVALAVYTYTRKQLLPVEQLSRAVESFFGGAQPETGLPQSVIEALGPLGLGVVRMMKLGRERARAQSESEMRARAITRAVLENSSDGVITVDQHGTICSYNAAAELMFGYPASEVIGESLAKLIPASYAELFESRLESNVSSGQPQMVGCETEIAGLRKDFSSFPMELTLSEVKVNDQRLFTAIMRDISERKRSADALMGSELRLRAILDTAADGIITVDNWGMIETFNAAAERMFGYRSRDIVGRDFDLLVAELPSDIPEGQNELEPEIRKMVGSRGQALGRRRDGTTFPMELAISEVRLGNELVFTAIVRNVTERVAVQEALSKRAEELARRNEELAQFAYVASHDLQEPLRMVSSYTQLLDRRYRGKLDEDADEFISFAVDGANRMQRLLRALLDYSRVGTRGQAFRSTSLEAVLERVEANLQTAVEESQAVLTHDPLPMVYADPSQMDQLFQNLLSNAIKFRATDPPRVHISAEREGGEWHLAVSDNGIGIDQEYHDRVFVIFQRLHTRDEFPGTGIGLAICKKIVERHGGRIWVESELGKGASFHVTIPDREPVAEPAVDDGFDELAGTTSPAGVAAGRPGWHAAADSTSDLTDAASKANGSRSANGSPRREPTPAIAKAAGLAPRGRVREPVSSAAGRAYGLGLSPVSPETRPLPSDDVTGELAAPHTEKDAFDAD